MAISKRMKESRNKAAANAIALLGGVSRASRILDIPDSTISNWRLNGIPKRHLAAVSAASAIPIARLRPDLEHERIAKERIAVSRKQETEKCNAQHTAVQPCSASAPASASAASQ